MVSDTCPAGSGAANRMVQRSASSSRDTVPVASPVGVRATAEATTSSAALHTSVSVGSVSWSRITTCPRNVAAARSGSSSRS